MFTATTMRRSLAAITLGTALVFAGQGQAAKDVQPVKIEKPQAWQGVNQVVIGQFTVAFFTKKIDYDGGGFLAASDKGKAIGHLSGVTNEQFQAITDVVYADFMKQLSAHGVAVVDDAGFRADKYYLKIKPESQANKVDVTLKKDDHADALAFWPTAMGRNTNALLSLRMMDTNMGNTYTAEYNYAKASGIPVLNVVYFVDFAKPAKSSGGGLLQGLKVEAGLAISPFGTQLALMGKDGKLTKMLLQLPIEEGGNFAQIEETTSGVERAVQVASILGAGLFGGKRGTLSARFNYNVTDPAAFSLGVQAAGSRTSDLFIRQMETLR